MLTHSKSPSAQQAKSLTPSVVGSSSSSVARRLCDNLYRWCGVHLDDSKQYLIENRLRTVIRDAGMKDLTELVREVEKPNVTLLRDKVIDALTTHETLFFRDQSPFDAIAKCVLPEILKNANGRKPSLRIWSAACSTGQEPYSLAMLLSESIPKLSDWKIEIIATDIAKPTVEFAKAGVYRPHEISRGIDEERKSRFFEEQEGNSWRVRDNIRSMIKFQVGNLNSERHPLGPFDLVFCRNVLIYFKPADARKIIERVTRQLSKNGRLFVGCSEVLTFHDDILTSQPIGNSICYQRASST